MPKIAQEGPNTGSAPDIDLISAFAGIVGKPYVVDDLADRRKYSRDRLPLAYFLEREGQLLGSLPALIVRPGSEDEVSQIIQFANDHAIKIIPYGGGSGVVGGTIPLAGEIILDLSRLDRVIAIDRINCIATAEAGLNGLKFETLLNQEGFTCGHLPQSIEISTIGGWAACRGAGQSSSRYGKIEDIVVGMRCVLADGSIIDIPPIPGRAVGPQLGELLIGSEGTLGVITALTLRIHELPEADLGLAVKFPNVQSAWDAARQIMQAEIRPSVVRIYDAVESAERATENISLEGHPIISIYKFSGLKAICEQEKACALQIISKNNGKRADQELYENWEKSRYNATSQNWLSKGYFNDTIEISANWSNISKIYKNIGSKIQNINSDIYFGAHWSHVYPEGVCQYMTFRFPPMALDSALPIHADIWDTVIMETLACGGSISHHHGIGLHRGRWLSQELGAADKILKLIKKCMDPRDTLNPGKLGFQMPAGAVDLSRFSNG